ncbi:MAG: AAA family ATPase [Clostridia bacterium]|nr:AAA family ATPase [Clostridia bacterium]
METIDGLVSYIRSIADEKFIRVLYFMEVSDILTYVMKKEGPPNSDKVKDKIEFPEYMEAGYLKLCSEDYEESSDMFGLFFLYYQGYLLKDERAFWKIYLNKPEAQFAAKCTYCNIPFNNCPMKVLAYIKKVCTDNHLDRNEVFMRLLNRNVEEEYSRYSTDDNAISEVANRIIEITGSRKLDIAGMEYLLTTEAVKIIGEEAGKLKFRSLNFNLNNISFINNINAFYNYSEGIYQEIDLADPKFESDYYMFEVSPAKVVAYFKYLCMQRNISEVSVLSKIYSILKPSDDENVRRLAYYKLYVQKVNRLDCDDEVKKQIIDVLTYIKNYYSIRKVPYIQFNYAFYTQNIDLTEKIINILNKIAIEFSYLQNTSTLFVDAEMLIKRAKDNNDVFFQMDKIFLDNSFVIFTNVDKIKYLNEYRVDTFFVALEKFVIPSRKLMFMLVGEKQTLEELLEPHKVLNEHLLNNKIYIKEYDAEAIKKKLLNRIKKVSDYNEGFEQRLSEYIDYTYEKSTVDENMYMQDVYNKVIFRKYDTLDKEQLIDIDSVPEIKRKRSTEEILDELSELVGLSEVKRRLVEILKYYEYSKKVGIEDHLNLNMVFLGGAGTGKTTVAKLFAELFSNLGYIKKDTLVEVTSKDLIGDHLGQTAPKTQKVIDSALDGVLLIDEAYAIMSSKGTADYPTECISTLCKAMDMYKGRLVVIFAGYTEEMNQFIQRNQGLMSRVGNIIEFPDYTVDELYQIFNLNVQKNGFTLEDGVELKIKNLFTKERIMRNFGNARYANNLFDKLVLTHATDNTDENKLKTLTCDDVDMLSTTILDKVRTIDEILADLNNLIGLENIKDVINGFVAVLELNSKINRPSDFNMHMIFKGNAGTGKTTVARLLAEIYYSLGYIRKNKLKEVQAQDLIGEYIGQTGPKTQAVIDAAIDGVLFIDEAYSLLDHGGQSANYTDECIATLLKAMEDYQGRLIVIFAGYKEEMKKFRDQNPGLKSRVGFELDFPDYSLDDLVKIFRKKITERRYGITESAVEKARKIMDAAKRVDNFGNGRFVENFIQRIIVEHAKKTRGNYDMDRLVLITEEDIPDVKAEESKAKIGF